MKLEKGLGLWGVLLPMKDTTQRNNPRRMIIKLGIEEMQCKSGF